ncbi:tRNA (adenosine(37)-N6)-threonylcarbamoyltransferase complex dimerization subunit type 1 TsaB [Polaribacter porphyrae]|uniref:tRNA (Adenosine(37)-N6)-threonylcarbamoyltransferase complex dimerization subunit type 1 TsaB n=1 Tax=Polaribacter porphyrae TaxID=1137780 RepID=A0A2S7WPE8_9FLAO|nr:tRNA (adenosine(37)-N6)-threonylcarbamoyltransferase complex dimerization subunit type 1 TsaB [Polaribacter porphyrae]PQJ79488.1 tRNA (adenosine(37)-N6)-threonylcarbamoyltransferase complex dimerization subunit type 1 TsaB [Polaribacter porphyrae]
MSLILNIETSTKNCSVSIANEGEVLVIKELNNGNYSHAEMLHPFIDDIINKSNISLSDIDAIAVSKGPGSYTGLRIGVSAAKGLCFAFDKPLISIDTLTSLSYSITINQGIIVPMIDARRMEVYSAIFDANHQLVREIKADIVDEETYLEYLEKSRVYFLGDGATKCKEIIKHKNAIFIESKYPSAREMAKLSFDKYKISDTENVAYFEPFYLKDFIVIPEKKKN